jgi:ATP-binding cassette subfamily B protein
MEAGNILGAMKISKSYPGVQALDGIDFDLHSGEVQALVGQNGAGKSTFIEIISGSLRPDSGQILFEGRTFPFLEPAKSIELGIQTVHQENQLVEELSVAENIYLFNLPGNRFGMMNYAQCQKAANALLSELGITVAAGRKMTQLTFIEKKLVSIAKAFSRQAKVLILDEPTASLDARAEYEVFLRFAELTKGKAAVLISHRFSTVRMAERILVLEKGQIVEQGSHEELVKLGGTYAELFRLQAAGYR